MHELWPGKGLHGSGEGEPGPPKDPKSEGREQ